MGSQEQEQDGWIHEVNEAIFSKGQSKRIWNEFLQGHRFL